MIELFFRKSGKKKVTLLEPFEDFEVKLRSYSRLERYKTLRKFRAPKYPFKIRTKKLEKNVEELRQRFPDKNYRLRVRKLWRRVGDKMKMVKMWVIRRGECCLDNPPLYYYPKEGRFFVPRSYVKNHYKLVCAVVIYRLNDLRVPLETR